MQLTAINQTGRSRKGTLTASYREIITAIFEPNATHLDDQSKVKASWGIEDSKGRKAFIWCYKYASEEDCFQWSIDGDMGLLEEIFPNKVKPF